MTTISSVAAVTSRASPETAPLASLPEQKPAQAEQKSAEAAKQQPPQSAAVADQAASAVSANVLRDVTLRYQMDPDTQKMRLLIIDRKSREIIRTLPPEDLLRMGVDRVFEGLA